MVPYCPSVWLMEMWFLRWELVLSPLQFFCGSTTFVMCCAVVLMLVSHPGSRQTGVGKQERQTTHSFFRGKDVTFRSRSVLVRYCTLLLEVLSFPGKWVWVFFFLTYLLLLHMSVVLSWNGMESLWFMHIPVLYTLLWFCEYCQEKTDRTDCVRPSIICTRTVRTKEAPPAVPHLNQSTRKKTVRVWYHYDPSVLLIEMWFCCGSWCYPLQFFCGSTCSCYAVVLMLVSHPGAQTQES